MTTKAMAIKSGKNILKTKVTTLYFDMLVVLKMNRKLFFSIAKVFVANFAGKNVIRESLCPQFRDFFSRETFCPLKFLPLKYLLSFTTKLRLSTMLC